MNLKILIGTVTQNAEHAAHAMQMACGDLVDNIEVLMMDHLGIDVFDQEALYVICTSTTGSGDVPDNAAHFYNALATEPKYLGSVRYGVFALGDSSYPETYCNGGVRFDERLADLGAVRVGDTCRHDASAEVDVEVAAAAWCREWLASSAPQQALKEKRTP